MPDVDTIRHLSQVLNYNFLAVEGMSADPQPAPAAEENSPQPGAEAAPEAPVHPETVPRKRRLVLPAVLLCAVLMGCRLMNGRPSGERAHVSITSAENPVKAIRFEEFPDGAGWFYEFRMEETGGIPFTVHELTSTTYNENGLENSQTFTAEQLADIWGSSTLTQGIPQSWTGGFPLQPVKGVGVVLKGTDANGNELEFTGHIELSKEIAE